MPPQIFKGKVFAAAGPLPGQLSVDNLKRWTSLRKGIFLEDFDESVTHLLCTKEQWDKKVDRSKILFISLRSQLLTVEQSRRP